MENFVKIVIIGVFALLIATLVPPLFAEGMIFQVEGVELDYLCGQYLPTKSLYFDNAHFSLDYLFKAFFGISSAFILPKGKWYINYTRRASAILGCWYLIGLVYEIFNFFIPEEVLNTQTDLGLYVRIGLVLILLQTITMIRETWIQTKN